LVLTWVALMVKPLVSMWVALMAKSLVYDLVWTTDVRLAAKWEFEMAEY
jgi:hypothetical protein